jgi:hypothetical protein
VGCHFLSLFAELFEFVCDLELEMEVSMDELAVLAQFRLQLPFGSNCTNHSDAMSTWYQEPV